jgi:nitroreductase
MNYDSLKQLIQERRSVRKFADRPVTDADIIELIDCARYAPSDTNSQTWEFVVVTNTDKIKAIEQMTWDELHRRAAEAEQKGLSREGRLLVKSFGPYATAFSDAPALIVCLATPYQSKFRERIFDPIGLVEDEVWREEGIKSSCLASMNLMLAAHARGLATCPMTGPVLLAEKPLKAFLGLDDTKQVNMVIALGHPAEVPGKLPRKDIEQILTIVK